MKDFSIEQDGAKLQKKTDGRKTETFNLELPEMINVKSGRSGLVGGFTVKTRETNSGFVLNLEVKVQGTGGFKGKGKRLSDLLEAGGVTAKDLEEAFGMVLQHAVKGSFSSTKELMLHVSSLVGKIKIDN